MTETVKSGIAAEPVEVQKTETEKSVNPMTQVRIEKLTLNIGTGKDQAKLERAMTLIKHITGIDAVKTITNKRIAAWGLRPGLPIGCKLTLRGKKAEELLTRLLKAKEEGLKTGWFDDCGNLSFGINEYIDIPDVKYETKIGMMGLQVCVTMTKPGYRVKLRKLRKKKVPHSHQVTKEQAIKFIENKFSVEVVQ